MSYSQQNQMTAADGRYRFDLLPGADPACPVTETEYRISFTAPLGFLSAPSTLIPPQSGPLDPTGGSNPFAVASQSSAPQGSDPTIYYLALLLASGDPDVVNNHIPLDAPAAGTQLLVSKTAARRQAAAGQLIAYTISVTNTEAAQRTGIDVVDQIPPGFTFADGSVALTTLSSHRSRVAAT